MQGKKHPSQEELVLLLQWQSKSIDNGPQNFEKLGDSVESLSLVCKMEEDVVDGTTDVRSEVEEFAVDTVKRGLEEVSFSRVFRVEELEQLDTVSQSIRPDTK